MSQVYAQLSVQLQAQLQVLQVHVSFHFQLLATLCHTPMCNALMCSLHAPMCHALQVLQVHASTCQPSLHVQPCATHPCAMHPCALFMHPCALHHLCSLCIHHLTQFNSIQFSSNKSASVQHLVTPHRMCNHVQHTHVLPTTKCNHVQPCATMCNHVQPCTMHLCATHAHNHVQPCAPMCNAPMCSPCAPCAMTSPYNKISTWTNCICVQHCISLPFSASLCISPHPSAFLCIPLHLSAFLCVPLHPSAFLRFSLYFSAYPPKLKPPQTRLGGFSLA